MRRAGIAITALVVALLATPAVAHAAPPDIDALEAQPCPPRYLPGGLDPNYEPGDVALAREQSRFEIAEQHYELVPPIEWGDAGDSQTFRFALTALNWTQILFDAYEVGDDGALLQARDILLDFAFTQRGREEGTAPWAWGTKRTGDRAALLAYLARAGTCEGILDEAQQRLLLRSVSRHGRFMLRNPAPTNHGLFDAYALGVIAEQLPFMGAAPRWAREGKSRFKRVFSGRVAVAEGFWLENSTRYHIAVTSLLERYLDLELADPAWLEAAVEPMRGVCGWLVEPDGLEMPLGDTWLGEAVDVCADAAPASGSATLRRSGAAFVRDDSSYLAQFAQFFNSTHKHSDDLSFELFDGGHRVITDTGDYHRDADHWRRFSSSAQAHSTLVVDGRDFSRRSEDAYGSGIVAGGAGDGWYAIHSSNPLRPAGVKHRRTLLYRPGVALIVVDRVRSGRRHRYERLFQFGSDFEAEAGVPGEPLELSAGDDAVWLADDSTAGAERSAVSGQTDPLAGWVVPTFRNAIARPTVTLESNGSDVDHVATISLDDSRLEAELNGPLGRDSFTVSLTDESGPAGGVAVSSTGSSMQVTETP